MHPRSRIALDPSDMCRRVGSGSGNTITNWGSECLIQNQRPVVGPGQAVPAGPLACPCGGGEISRMERWVVDRQRFCDSGQVELTSRNSASLANEGFRDGLPSTGTGRSSSSSSSRSSAGSGSRLKQSAFEQLPVDVLGRQVFPIEVACCCARKEGNGFDNRLVRAGAAPLGTWALMKNSRS